MNLSEYIKVKYNNKEDWFIQEVADYSNQSRIQDVLANKEYLNGVHDITKRKNYVFNGQTIESRRIVLQTAKTLLQFQVEYLLKHDIQVTGNEKMADTFSMINKIGRYSFTNRLILDKVLKFGMACEYIWIDRDRIRSKVLDPSEFTPMYNKHNDLMAVIEHYTFDGITSYVVYSEDVVQEYDNTGGRLKLTAQYANLSGLPIVYTSADEYGGIEGVSQLEDWKGLLSAQEDLISKTMDATYKAISGIPVISGQQLKGSMPADVVSGGIQLEDGSSFDFKANVTDIQSFEVLFESLNKSLLNISMTPAISMNAEGISNVSTESIRLMFSLANVRASLNENYLKRGLYERYEKIRRMLQQYRGITMTDTEFYSLSLIFTYDQVSNETETIANLKTLRELNAISMESLLERSPFTTDAIQESERLKLEGIGSKIEENTLVG